MKKHIFKALSMAVMSTSLLFSNTATAQLKLEDEGTYTKFTLTYPTNPKMTDKNFNPLGISDRVFCSNSSVTSCAPRKFIFDGKTQGCPSAIGLSKNPSFTFKVPLLGDSQTIKPIVSTASSTISYASAVMNSANYATSPTITIMPPAALQNIAAAPTQTASYTFFGLVSFGVAIDGVPFDPNTGDIWGSETNGRWRVSAIIPGGKSAPDSKVCPGKKNNKVRGTAIKINGKEVTTNNGKLLYGCLGIDENTAHVAPAAKGGTFNRLHYHAMPWDIPASTPLQHSPIIGYAADGYPIYGMYVYAKDGTTVQKAKSGYALPVARSSVVYDSNETGKFKVQNINANLVQTGKDDTGAVLSMLMPSTTVAIPTWKGAGRAQDSASAFSAILSTKDPMGAYDQDYVYTYTDGALDPCNGTYNRTPEYPKGTYYYVVTDSYPFVPRCFGGSAVSKIDASFISGEGDSGAQ